jgi:hypothetical protein
MPDFDDLSTFTDGFSKGSTVTPLPASEVRRRGDRMRRRNTAFATVGGVVAAAVFIGTPVALLNNSGDSDVQPAPPAPSQTQDAQFEWVTEIPSDFPVTAGMVTGAGEATEGDLDALDLCDTSYPTSRGTADSQTWFYSDDGESSLTRVLQLWPDDAAAYQSLDRLEEAVAACPQEPASNGEDVVETRLVDVAPSGVASVTFTQQLVADDGLRYGLTTVQVTQVGNAVLVDWSYGAAGGDEAIEIALGTLADRSTETRAAMCVFDRNPCGTVSPPPSVDEDQPPAVATAIPADFPLARGMNTDPEGGELQGPGADVEGAPLVDVCGLTVWEPSLVVDRLAVRETGIEYLETRELVTFATADEASESVTLVREAVSACPRIEGETYDRVTRVLEGTDEYDSFSWGYYAEEALDGGVFQITRVGSSVLVVFSAGEMSEASLQTVADEMVPTTLDLAPEMCVFTEDGC